MTDAPTWPGVAEYLYHAASSELVTSDGTWIMPSELTPRCSSFEFTPMAGILTDTGTERCNDGPWALPADSPIAPAAARDGCGACSWALTATPAAAPPPMMRRTPTTPATRARRLPDVLSGGAEAPCRQYMTTRNPAIRRHPTSPIPSSLPPSSPGGSTRVA